MDLSKLNKNPVAWYTTGTILRQLTAIIMLPIYTQYLSPEEYGIVGVLAVILGVYELFLGARFGVALPKFFYDRETSEQRYGLISTALLSTITMSVIGAAVFSASAPYLAADFFERPELTYALVAYGITLLTSSIEEYTLVFFRLEDKPFFFFVMSMAKLCMQLSLNVYFLIYLGMGVEGVIYSGVIASGFFAAISFVYTIGKCGFKFNKAELNLLLVFTWPIWLSGFATLYITLTTNFLIKHFASLEEVGFYHFALKFSSLIGLLIWRPFNQWWQTERFKVAKDISDPKPIFSSAFILITTLMSIGAFGISTGVETLIDIMADPAYLAASNIVPVLCLMTLLNLLNFFLNFSFFKAEKTKVLPKVIAFKAILLTLTLTSFSYQWQLYGALSALLLCQIVEFFTMYILSKKYYDLGLPILAFLTMISATAIGILVTINFVGLDIPLWPRIGYLVGCFLLYLIFVTVFLFVITEHGKQLISFTRRRWS
ncbi:lipopolysaccharide biosynthesis protein [Alteromonas lipotrueiana]|uniref:lipopolysaccharide biosynthesis protein n=1 Tax=Alteromonas lipotrueiana TaxID=2803815 RepID=UPI001C441987|nr:oligosaccharide flippase family protein [Alteromonas lipotrueiana]